MKMKPFIFVFATLLVLACSTSFSQDTGSANVSHSTPKWIPRSGYWVVESNVNMPKHNIVYFYNNENVLVYKETIDGIVLKLNKRKTKMILKKLVDQTTATYMQKQMVSENEMLVVKMIR